MNKLLSNLPINLNKDNDLLGTIDKADAITYFLNNNLDSFDEIKMIALFGGWGTGKTSIMYRIKNSLPKKKFKSIFFEAWKHERDNNIALSLVSLFNAELEDDNTKKELILSSWQLFKSALRGIEISSPSFPGMPQLTIKPKDTLEDIEKSFKQLTDKSFLEEDKKFKLAFQAAEDEIAKQLDENGKIIVFIDDLDRCEPENVIQLLSLIKLFFIYGKRTIFFCGVDKEAVNNAIKTKYRDIIKSEEYIEKIFDCSFNVTLNYDLIKLINHYYKGNISFTGVSQSVSSVLDFFFKSIEFENPRHVKKVMNKLQILKSYRNSTKNHSKYTSLIPNLYDDEDNTENIFQIILTIFIIILYEFNQSLFLELENYDSKSDIYSNIRYLEFKERKPDILYQSVTDSTHNKYFSYNLINLKLSEIVNLESNLAKNGGGNFLTDLYFQLYIIFLPLNNVSRFRDVEDSNKFISQFENENNKILIRFCQYLHNHQNLLFSSPNAGDYKIINLFKMARTIL